MPASIDLPSPDPAFRWTRETWGAALRCRPLEAIAQHLFTTRQLQLRGVDSDGEVWRQVAAAVGGSAGHLLRVKQVHGRHVRVVRADAEIAAEAVLKPEADALASGAPGAILAVQVADCVPILIADPLSGAVAAVHAGWRGTAAGIARAAVEALGDAFGARASALVAAIGPSIGPCCYEVGAEVRESFRRDGATADSLGRWFRTSESGSWYLDLWAANHDQLVASGVSSAAIHTAGLCTRTRSDIFDSYRADGPRAGRMAAVVRGGERQVGG